MASNVMRVRGIPLKTGLPKGANPVSRSLESELGLLLTRKGCDVTPSFLAGIVIGRRR